MRARRKLVGMVSCLALVISLVPFLALPAAAVSAPEVVATGLDSPYKLTHGPNGDLFVAEAGVGGTDCVTVQGPEGDEVEACRGTSGAVTRISGTTASTRVSGLPSVRLGDEVIGPADIGFDSNGVFHVLVGLGGDLETRTLFGDERFGTLIRVPDVGAQTVVADLAAFEEANDPDAGLPGVEGPDSNPFGLAFDGTDALVADAGGNTLLRVTGGAVQLEALFPPRMVDPPPFIPIPGQIPMQSVPTAVEIDSGGVVHVSELTGFPFQVGAANIYTLDGTAATPALTGFTNIMDFAIAADGTVYVLLFAANGLLSEVPEAALVQVRPDGTRKTLLYGQELPVPGGVTVGPDGMVYLSVCTLCGPGEGMVWRVDPSVASDPNTAAACDPEDVPGTGFEDIADNLHREAIECAAWWDVVNGFAPDRFGPGADITRAQTASMIARALRSAGVALPADAPDAFPDDEGSVHEDDINALAAEGVILGRTDGTFDPAASVSRAEVTSLLARAYASATGAALPTGADAFTDDETSVHEADINAVAAAGWVKGVGGGLFQPTGNASRGQFSSMVARMLATLVGEGVATPPSS